MDKQQFAARPGESGLDADQIQHLRIEMLNPRFLQDFIDSAGSLVHPSTTVMAQTRFLADLVEPVDSILGMDPESLHRRDFALGIVLGVSLGKLLYPHLEKDLLEKVAGSGVDVAFYRNARDGAPEIKHQLGQQILEEGYRAIRQYPWAEQIITDLADRFCRDAQTLLTLKSAIGMGFHWAYQAAEDSAERDLRSVADRLQRGADFALALEVLLDEADKRHETGQTD